MDRRGFLRALGLGAAVAPALPAVELGRMLTSAPANACFSVDSFTVPMCDMYGWITPSSQTLRASDLNASFDRILAAMDRP